MSTDKTRTGFHPSQIFAAGLAAVTAATLGSTLGVAGTVLGAALGSVVTTVAAEFYLRSLKRVRTRTRDNSDKPDESVQDGEERPPQRVRWQLLAGVSVAAFVLGMVVITGIEWVRGEPLSGDAKTTIGGVLQPPRQPSGIPTQRSTTPPPTTTTVTVTPPPSTPSTPSATTTPPPSGTSGSSSSPPSTTTATTDPVQSNAPSQPPTTP
jgi:hypothetical protein